MPNERTRQFIACCTSIYAVDEATYLLKIRSGTLSSVGVERINDWLIEALAMVKC